jgi:hypothetical protein
MCSCGKDLELILLVTHEISLLTVLRLLKYFSNSALERTLLLLGYTCIGPTMITSKSVSYS